MGRTSVPVAKSLADPEPVKTAPPFRAVYEVSWRRVNDKGKRIDDKIIITTSTDNESWDKVFEKRLAGAGSLLVWNSEQGPETPPKATMGMEAHQARERMAACERGENYTG
jgi:hypothetical protein